MRNYAQLDRQMAVGRSTIVYLPGKKSIEQILQKGEPDSTSIINGTV